MTSKQSKDIMGAELSPADLEIAGNGGNGNGPLSGIPGAEDVVVDFAEKQGSPHLLLVTGSEEPKEYLPRAVLSVGEIGDILEILADANEVDFGDTDIVGLIATKCNASVAVGGNARKEYIEVSVRSAMDRAGRFFNRLTNGPPPQGNR